MSNGLRWVVDLLLVLAVTALAAAVVVLDVGGWIRAFLVVPLVIFAPGWALLAALYPEAPAEESRAFDADKGGLSDPNSEKAGIDGVERLAFAALGSVVIVPLVGIAVHFSPVAITATPVLVGLVGVTVALTFVAFMRRTLLPVDRRYEPRVLAPVTRLPFRESRRRMGSGGSRATGFNVALAFAVLLFGASIGYAAINPPQQDAFTELSVDTGNVTADTQSMYPAEYTAGETRTLSLLLSNHEHEPVDYQVVVELQRLGGENGQQVVDEARIDSRSLSLDPEDTRYFDVDVSPSMTGDDLRLVVLAYTGEVPSDPTVENAHQSLELPIDVAGE